MTRSLIGAVVFFGIFLGFILAGSLPVRAVTAVDDRVETNEDTTVTINVLGNDSPLTGLRVGSVKQPAHGTAVVLDASAGTIQYTPTQDWNGTDCFSYTVAEGGSMYCAATGHYYEFVSAPGGTWDAAGTDAAARSLYGLHGYLATITSAEEQLFVESKLQGQGWMGASDFSKSDPTAADGTWRWVTGPEGTEDGGRGRHFFQETGGSYGYASTTGGGYAVGGCYSHWASGEPNNADGKPGNEDYAHFLTSGFWNDFNDTNASTAGYVVEYGGMANDVPAFPTATVTVTVNPINDAPVITEGSSVPVTIDEDSYPKAFALTLHAGDIDGDALSWCIQMPAGHGMASVDAAGSVQYAPNANWNGNDGFAVQITDGHGGSAMTTITVTVRPRNDPPVNTSAPVVSGTPHPGQTLTAMPGSWADAIDNPTTAFTFGYRWQASNDGATWSNVFGATQQQYSVASPDVGKMLRCAVTCYDADVSSGYPQPQVAGANSESVTVANTAPLISEGSQTFVTMSEDGAPAAWSLLLNASDPDGDSLVWSIVSQGTHGTAAVSGAGARASVSYAPATNWSGEDSFTVQVADGWGGRDAITVEVTVLPVNDPPSFVKGADQTVLEDCGSRTIEDWATSISAGPDDEFGQSLTFAVTCSSPGLFKVGPSINVDGALSFTPNNDANGTATLTVVLQDNGGTSNGGVNASTPQTFTITVSPVNDPPSYVKGSDQSSYEDWGPQSVFWAASVSAGPADEAGQALSFSVTNDNMTLFSAQPSISNNGVLTYTAAPDMNGHATVTVTLHDDGGTSNGGADTSVSATFTITILPVNDPPTFVKGSDQTVIEDCGSRTIAQWATSISAGPGETAHTLTFLVFNVTSPWLFAEAPSISFNGDLSFTPAPNANGSATMTVVLQDDGGTDHGGNEFSDPQTFTITVTPVNDPPSFTRGADQTVLEDCGPQTVASWATRIAAGAPNESGQVLTFEVTANTNPGLFAAGPAISSTGTLSFTPAANANGAATITVTLTDDATAGGAALTTAPQTFAITVTPVNDAPLNTAAPSISGTMNVGEMLTADAGAWNDTVDTGVSGSSTLTFAYQWIRGDDALGTHATNISSATSSTYFVTDADAHKCLAVRVCCTDDGVGPPANQSASLTTSWTPEVVNRVPSISEGSSALVTMDEDGSPTTFGLTLHGVDADGDLLAWSIATPALHGTATVSGTGTATTVGYAPLANWNGVDTVVVRVNDGYGGTGDITVMVRIDPRNDPPANTTLPQVSGTAHAGCLLTATTGTWNDAIDLVPGTLAWGFQWQRSTDGSANFVDIPRANAATYLLTTEDNLQFVRCVVTCTDSGEGLPLHQSTSTGSVPVPVLNAAPIISEGAATSVTCDEDENPMPFGATLHAMDADGIDALAWHITAAPSHGLLVLAVDSSGIVVTPAYHPTANWNGTDAFTLRVDDGLGGFAEIRVIVVVNPCNDAPVNTSPPSIDGDAFVYHEVHANVGSWNDSVDLTPGNLTYTYQWLRAGVASGTGLEPISGATTSSYVVSPLDEYMYLSVRITCTDSGVGVPMGMTTSADSALVLAQYLDIMPPTIELPGLSSWPGVLGYSGGDTPSFTVTDAAFTLPFAIDDDRLNGVRVSVSVGGHTVACDRNSSGVLQLTEGSNSIVINAVDAAGNVSSRHVSIMLDTRAPVVTLSTTLPPAIATSRLSLAGSIRDSYSGVRSLTIDGVAVTPYADGTFQYDLNLKKGENTIVVTTVDGVGNAGSQTYHISYTTAATAPFPSRQTMILAIGSSTMTVGGVRVALDAPAAIVEGRTLVPLRALVEHLGGSISWNAKKQQVTVKARGTTIVLAIGRSVALVDGKAHDIDPKNDNVVPLLTSGRTMLPLRFVAESLGLQVDWDAETRVVTLSWDS